MDVELIIRLRRMAAEPTPKVYSDAELWQMIESTGDLNRVAGDIWVEKAAALSAEFDFDADGGKFARSQKYAQAMRQAQHFYSRSKTKSVEVTGDHVQEN